MVLQKELQKAKKASYALVGIEDKALSRALRELAGILKKKSKLILAENAKDLAKIAKNNPIYDRVLLDQKRINGIAESLKEVAAYKSPVDIILEKKTLKNGLVLKKTTVPLGVVGVIFEARPNVVIDVFALCFKSKNVAVLKGGSDSSYSNEVLVKIIKEVLKKNFGRDDFVLLLPNDREIVGEMLKSDEYIDVIIPRGGKGLISFVRQNSRIPVIETGAGVVHTYFDESGKVEMARDIVFNAKTQRCSVCNALDTLIVNEKRIKDLPKICSKLKEKNVEIFADEKAYKVLNGKYPFLKKAKKENFGMEFLSLRMSIKTVPNLEAAIEHINTYGSHHSEAIITGNKKNAEKFLKFVDAACVYVNASTRFTDGGQFGLGAEIGISTQKLHARGPMGIRELTSYKWLISGKGQVRP